MTSLPVDKLMDSRTTKLLARSMAVLLLLPASLGGVPQASAFGACEADDPWFGGTTIDNCAFQCEGPGTIHISVSSSDEDAEVQGSGSCGNGVLSCGFEAKECTDVDKNTQAGPAAGDCSASSDEVWSSALKVDCWDEPETKPIDPTPECPLPPLCESDFPGPTTPPCEATKQRFEPSDAPIPAISPHPDFSGILDAIVAPPDCVSTASSWHVTIWMAGEESFGRACGRGSCVAFAPACRVVEHIRTCSVGGG